MLRLSRPGIDYVSLSLLGPCKQRLFSPPAMLSSWVSLSLLRLQPYESLWGALYPLSLNYLNLLIAVDWIQLQPRSHHWGISPASHLNPLFDIWSQQVEGFPSAKCRDGWDSTEKKKFCVRSQPLRHKSSFMVQFIWHLIRCTSTSEKHKLPCKWSIFLTLKGLSNKGQWNVALVVLHVKYLKPRKEIIVLHTTIV